MQQTPPQPSNSKAHYQRLYRLLSELSESMFMLASNFDAICQQACRIAAETGGYQFAFVALIDPKQPYLEPNFQYGVHKGYLTGLRLSCDPSVPEGQGPTGIAVRTQRPVIVNDYMSDPLMATWRYNAIKADIHAHACFPLIAQNGDVFGVFNLYHNKPNPFNADEIELLGRLALGLSISYERKLDEDKRELADEDRRQAQIKFAGILEAAGDAILAVDDSQRIQLFNKAAEEIFGYSAREVIGRSIDLLLPQSMTPAHGKYIENFSQLPNEGKERIIHHEVVGMRRDGSLFPASNTLAKLRYNGGWLYVATVRDISAIKSAESRLLQLQASIERAAKEWRTTFDALTLPIITITGDLRILRVNAAARTLMDEDYREIIGSPLTKFFSNRAWSPFLDTVVTVLRTGEPGHVQVADNVTGRRWHVTVTPWEATGSPSVVAIAYDVTDLLNLQENLRRSEVMSALGHLVAGVSHEVRNPIFGMSATLDAFELRYGRKPEYARYIESLRKELTRVSELVRDLLDYGKSLEIKVAPVSLSALVNEAVTICAPILENKQLRLCKDLPADLPPITADGRKLVTVLKNLLENAAQFSLPQATIDVTAHVTFDGNQGWLWCAVRDRGPGIPTEDIPGIFRPFFSNRHGGTGLGLSIVQRIIENHRGIVRAANHPEGGAIFSFGISIE